jgi:hypothetical protein
MASVGALEMGAGLTSVDPSPKTRAIVFAESSPVSISMKVTFPSNLKPTITLKFGS